MSSLRAFKQKLAIVHQHWEEKAFDAAFAEVDLLLKQWPGNAHLLILWASLVQLQEKPQHSLDEAKQALQQAIDLDRKSPAGAIELGHFLDGVEDNPQAASKVYSEGVAFARHLLMEGLIGQAKALLQLDKKESAFQCVMEVLQLMHFEKEPKRSQGEEMAPDILFRALKGPFANQVEELLGEVLAR